MNRDDGAIERIRRTVKDPHVEVTLVSGDEPSPVSPTDDAAYALLEATLGDVFPGTVAVPYVMLAATDSRHFHRVWPRVDGIAWHRRLVEQL